MIPSINAHGKIIEIQKGIGIKRRTDHKKIYPGCQQNSDHSNGVNEYIIFSGIPYTKHLGNGAYPFGPFSVFDVLEKLIVKMFQYC